MGFKRILFIFNFIVQTNFAIYPILQYPKTHFSKIPAFHHSNWGEAPNLKYQGVNLVGVAVWVPYRQYFGIWSAKKLPLALDELP